MVAEPREHSLETGVGWMRAAGEPTRLRLLALLDRTELTVSDLVEILNQSQPRVSRHLRLLVEAGLAQRFQEGAWAYFRTADHGAVRKFLDIILHPLASKDELLAEDNSRLSAVQERRTEKAEAYFTANAEQWNRIRSLHIAEQDVEDLMLDLGLKQRPESLLDLGTGTGRILQLFAGDIRRGVGIDSSGDMLAFARTAISKPEFSHLQVRQGDVYKLSGDEKFDLIVLHQVLHYLESPDMALKQAAARLSKGGRVMIVDFAPHEFEFLRDDHAHRRLGVSDDLMEHWLSEAGLIISESQKLEPLQSADAALSVVLWLAEKH